MVPKENKSNAYAKFGGTNEEYYGIFRTGLLILAREESRVLYNRCAIFILPSYYSNL